MKKNKPSESGNSGKHAKPQASQALPPMTKEQRLQADINLIDGAYEKNKKESKTPATDANKSILKPGSGKRRKK